MIDSDNLHPILVDEMPPAFFRSKKSDKGEEFIKYMANIRESKHPILIATTNHDNFSIEINLAAARTTWQSITHLTKLKQSNPESTWNKPAQANNTLFCDYVLRMQNILSEHQSLATSADFWNFPQRFSPILLHDRIRNALLVPRKGFRRLQGKRPRTVVPDIQIQQQTLSKRRQ